jgi:hypothetical protein
MGKVDGLRPCFANERRAYERIRTVFDATLFVPVTTTTLACWVLDISAGGATLRCKTPLRKETSIILYLESMGRFEAITKHWSNCCLGVAFTCGAAKRQRLLEKISRLVTADSAQRCRQSSSERVHPFPLEYFERFNGESVKCEILDISHRGLSLKTMARPVLGEIVRLGARFGCIVRHHEQGVGVELMDEGQCPPPAFEHTASTDGGSQPPILKNGLFVPTA